MSKQICFIRTGGIKTIDAIFHGLHEHFSKEFGRLFFVNVGQVFTSRLFHYKPVSKAEAKEVLPANFTYIVPKSLSDFKKFLTSHDLVVICYFSETWSDWWIHHYLKKYSIPLVYIHTHSTVAEFLYNRAHKELIFVRLWKKIKMIHSRFLRKLALKFFLHDVDTIFVSNKNKAEKTKNFRRGHYGKSEVVITNSRFYDAFLLKNYEVSNDYVVFLDSMLPYHGDLLRFGFQPINRELYYKNLNRVFDTIESVLGKELVICLHPKYNEKNLQRDFGGRKTVKYRTDEFVAKAELVLFHESSAVNSAIVYGKKIIQLIGSEFNDFTKDSCLCYQKCLSIATLDIYQCDENQIIETIKTIRFNRKEYESFLSDLIIASGRKGVSSCEQIADHISKKYGIAKMR